MGRRYCEARCCSPAPSVLGGALDATQNASPHAQCTRTSPPAGLLPEATSCPGAGAVLGVRGSVTPDSLLAQVMLKPSLTATQQIPCPTGRLRRGNSAVGRGSGRGRGMRHREPGPAAGALPLLPPPAPAVPGMRLPVCSVTVKHASWAGLLVWGPQMLMRPRWPGRSAPPQTLLLMGREGVGRE